MSKEETNKSMNMSASKIKEEIDPPFFLFHSKDKFSMDLKSNELNWKNIPMLDFH